MIGVKDKYVVVQIKRPNRSDDGSVPAKRRKRPTAEEEEAASLAPWQTRALNDFKIYNRTTTEAPAELFRKDLISAMKLPDSEPLAPDEYWVISDPWKQEWERGVQVPVNPDSLPEPSVTVTHCSNSFKPQHEFKLPKTRYIRITKDDRFKSDEHLLSNAPALGEAACSYDLDECDVAWLKLVNEERLCMGMNPITEDQLERVLERLEIRCWDKIQSILRNEEGLGIEYDENVICDVCRSPDSEEGNEMVFCDSCNICVHQACYGITRIPEGQWLCCTCALSQRPDCVLCPNKGGAMKCTRSGKHWAHVSCALWIPEVSIGCVEKMEPITKISSIPQSRWALICVLCRERVGACIQCSVKTCKTAYHVTCAFKHGLEMRAIIEDENADDGVKLRSYCEKHSKSSKKEKSVCSGSEDDDSKRRKRKDMTSEEKNQARAARLQEIESEFYKHVSVKDIVNIEIDNEALQYIYNYWKLKRKAGNNKPLLPPKSDDVDMLSHKQEQADLEKMKMFVQLRQDLERVRNLCYMVSRREKLSRTFFRMREQTFHKQAAVLASGYQNLSMPVVQAVIEANHGPSIYDRLYSHNGAEDHTTDFDIVLARIAGLKSPQDERRSDYNGVFKENNPYKKVYFNGSSKRRSGSLYDSSMSSASSSDERPKDKENRMQTSSEEEKVTSDRKKITSTHKRNTNSKVSERRHKRSSVASKTKVDSSSEGEVKKTVKDWGSLSKSRLVQMENELGISGSDSDDLMPFRTSKQTESQKTAVASIYSDSDSTDTSTRHDDKSSNAASDSQQNRMRTKAAVKEFSQKPSTSKCPNKSSSENKKRTKEDTKRNAANKAKDYVPSDLIVPQRKAAKKASENMKSTTTGRVKEQQHSNDNEVKTSVEEKIKNKPKLKATKDIKEVKEAPKKELKNDIFDIDKEMDKLENQEILAYVPQRQAAKKATEHIKSLGKPGVIESDADKAKIAEHNKIKKIEPDIKKKEVEEKPAKVFETKRKSSSNSSTSSTSSSSTDSSSSSTSDSEDEPQSKTQSESSFLVQSREPTKRSSAKDRPFLDKDAKSSATSSSSDSSDSSRSSTPTKPIPVTKPKVEHVNQQEQRKPHVAKSIRKSTDKKSTPPEREEPVRIRGKGRRRGRPRSSNAGDWVRDVNVRPGDIANSQRRILDREEPKIRKGKSIDMEDQSEKESDNATKPIKLLSPIRKADKKLDDVNLTVSNLEKEILERKAGREGVASKAKSTLDKLFRSDKKEKLALSNIERQKSMQKLKSPEKVSKISDTLTTTLIKAQKPAEKLKSAERPAYSEKLDKSNKPSEKDIKGSDVSDKIYDKAIHAEKLSLKSPDKVKSPEKSTNFSEKSIKSPEKSLKSPGKLDRTLEKTKNHENQVDKLLTPPEKDSEVIIIDDIASPINTPDAKNKCELSDKAIVSHVDLESTITDEKNFESVHQICDQLNDRDLDRQKTSPSEEKKQTNAASQSRSIFSPQPHDKETDLFDEFDNILPDDFGMPKEDDVLKNPMAISINNVSIFKEDSKEDSARETLNLVEKLRMEMSKKSTSYDVDDSVSVASSIRNDSDRAEFTEQIVPNNVIETTQKDDPSIDEQRRTNIEMRIDITEIKYNEKEDIRYTTNQVNIVTNDVLTEQHQHVHHTVAGEADERWVPPSDTYQNVEQKTYTSHNSSDITQSYLSNFEGQHLGHTINNVQVDAALPTQNDNSSLPSQMDVSADDEMQKSQSPNLQDRRVTQTPYLDPASMDCIPSPSPYADIHPQAKWADRHVIPNRRSSSSSAASTTSSPAHRTEVEDELMKRQEMMIVNPMDVPYGVIPPFAPNPLEGFSAYTDQPQCSYVPSAFIWCPIPWFTLHDKSWS
ncbi:Enhancer of polycomb-like [Popillia japonica]|uniref:PHD finger protein rhinoceros n=1 Tax=Popillia japonica TaxID=7064 RepID=A0AAW1MXE1_POPJA